MINVESFNLDHTKVRAPYIRLAGSYKGRHGDEVRKFDLRLVQPNKEAVPIAALHTMEHLIASYLREAMDHDVIDASPMGCRTGFYLTVMGEASEEEVKKAFQFALQAIADYKDEIPGVSELECGNYRDHSLKDARIWAAKVLETPIIVQPTITIDKKT